MSVPKVPDAPQWKRSELAEAESPAATDTVTADGQDFVPRTLWATAIVAGFCALGLAGFGRFVWIAPFIGGAVLGGVLLIGMERVMRRVLTADAVLKARRAQEAAGAGKAPSQWKKKFGGKGAMFVFALIKYPAVALLLWWVARHLTREQIAAFISGFILLQVVIGLRGVGSYLFPAKSGK